MVMQDFRREIKADNLYLPASFFNTPQVFLHAQKPTHKGEKEEQVEGETILMMKQRKKERQRQKVESS